MSETEWRVLKRTIAIQIYENWKGAEKMIASKLGINIPEDKNSPQACAAYTSLYEAMCEHFRQMSDRDWKNF